MNNTLPLIPSMGRGLLLGVAERAKRARLSLGWSRQLLAEKSGVNLWSLRRFEQTGLIAFDSLVRIAASLGRSEDIIALFQPNPAPKTMKELESAFPEPRKRGRTVR